MVNVTISMDAILHSLGFLNSSNKRWLAEHLIEQATAEESVENEEKERAEKLDYFLEKFRTDEISEKDIWEECEAVRQEMYEERLRAR